MASCSTTVHLNDRYLAEDHAAQLKNLIGTLGYKVKRRDNTFPTEVKGNTIVYYPSRQSDAQLHELQDVLADSGYEVANIYPAKIGSHHYTKSNIGVYLIPSNTAYANQPGGFDPAVVDAEFFSEGCHNEAILNILPDGRYLIESLSEPKAFPDLSGLWEIVAPDMIQFYGQGVQFLYTINKRTFEHPQYFEHHVTLMPVQESNQAWLCQSYMDCHYRYRVGEFKY